LINIFYLKKILNCKLTFKVKKKKILLFDGNKRSVENLTSIFKKKNFEELNIRGEKLNFYILLYTLFKNGFKNIIKNYKIEYIKKVNPKVIITFSDTNKGFFQLKKFFPKIKFIAVQSSNRGIEFFDKLEKYNIDYYFTFNKFYTRSLKKKISAKYIQIGSFKSNIQKYLVTNKKDVAFISKQVPNSPLGPVPKHELEILKILNKFCTKNNLKLHIILKHDMVNTYKSFLLKKKFLSPYTNIIYSKKKYGSYKVCKDFQLIVNSDSTLGYELLSMSKKVVFICYGSKESKNWYKQYKYPFKINNFGYPGLKKNIKGNFWCNQLNKKFILKILNKNYKMSYQRWFYKNKKLIEKIMPRDENNSKVLNLIKNIIKNG